MFEDGQLGVLQERERVRDRRRQVGNLLSLFGMAVLVAAVPGIAMLQMVLAERAERRAWAIAGPACPVVAKPSPMGSRRRGDPMSHDYGGNTFTRSFGAVSCAGFREPALFDEGRVYHVCQFNNPGAVVVNTSAGTTTFEGPPGRRLTVTVREGRPACVVGGWFSLH